VEGLKKHYLQGKNPVEVLKGLSFDIAPGEQVAIVGASGSGKSTLLHLLGGLDTPSEGKLIVGGHDLAKLGPKRRGNLRNEMMGFIYQFHHLLPEFSALENVAMPLLIGGMNPRDARNKSSTILAKVGLADRVKHKPGELSGGERQRAAIARALVTKPKIVLADEPTGNLDEKTAEKVYQLMLTLNQELGTSFLVVTHDMGLAQRMDRMMVLTSGHLQSDQINSTSFA
jgi:lipoprotein-releasing system ATP-binding protein